MQVVWQEEETGLKPYHKDGDDLVPAAWAPQPGSQTLFLASPVFETLYEGTRGPGKTDALLMCFCQHVGKGWGSDWRGILFRRTYPELQDVIEKALNWIPRIWPEAAYNRATHTWTWPTGESLSFRHFNKESDYWSYHGHAYPCQMWEELTTWPDSNGYTKMFSCCRSTRKGIPLMVRATTNPYGIGHNWVKMRFRLPIAPGRIVGPIIKDSIDHGGNTEPHRVSIHGKLSENRVLLYAQPDYEQKIRAAAKNPTELKAWLEGSWDIVAGGMFDDVWDPHTHVVEPFNIPRSWRIDRSFDWGSSHPFSVGWWAQSDGTDLTLRDGRTISTVRGDLYRIAEWYGWNKRPNEGLKMLAAEISKGIIERELNMGIHGLVKAGPADTQIYKVENGMCMADDMRAQVRIGTKLYPGVTWVPADKSSGSRKTGWEMIRKMLKDACGVRREKPGLFVFRTCEQFIRTVPVLPRDEKDLDDVDTEAEDHIGDETRYRVRFVGQQPKVGRTVGLHAFMLASLAGLVFG